MISSYIILFNTLRNIVFPFHFTWPFPVAWSNCRANYSTSTSFLVQHAVQTPMCQCPTSSQSCLEMVWCLECLTSMTFSEPFIDSITGGPPPIAKRSHRLSSNAKVAPARLWLQKLPAFVIWCTVSFFATAVKIATPNPNISQPNISKDFQIYPNWTQLNCIGNEMYKEQLNPHTWTIKTKKLWESGKHALLQFKWSPPNPQGLGKPYSMQFSIDICHWFRWFTAWLHLGILVQISHPKLQ